MNATVTITALEVRSQIAALAIAVGTWAHGGCFAEAPSISGDGCTTGVVGCRCTQDRECEPGLACQDQLGRCYDPECAAGQLGCPCDGGCVGDLVCEADLCTPGGTGSSDESDGSAATGGARDIGGCDTNTVYPDADSDGFGDPDAPASACGPLEGHVDNADDCDDSDPRIHPGGFACGPDPTGLIAWYRLDEPSRATVLLDSSENGFDADNLGGAELGIASPFGSGIATAGESDRIAIHDAAVAANEDLLEGTIEAWLRLDSVSLGDPLIPVWLGQEGQNGLGTGPEAHLAAFESDRGWGGWVSGSTSDCATMGNAAPITTGVWTHVAVVWSRGVCTVFVDGQAMSSGGYTGTLGPWNRGYLGGPDEDAYVRHWPGEIDEVMIFKRARTPQQIVADCGAC